MAMLGGILEQACDGIRAAVNEPAITSKLPNSVLLPRIADSYTRIGKELQALSEHPLISQLDYTVDQTVSTLTFQLPATCTTIRQIIFLDSEGTFMGQCPRMRAYESTPDNIGYQLNGSWLQIYFSGTANGISTVRILYEPFGYLPCHYGTLGTSARDTVSGEWINPTAGSSITGQQDFRPNAYVGAWFRVYLTASAPTGYTGSTNYNTIERRCDSWDALTHRITLDDVLDFTDGGNWTYEILPSTSWDFWQVVVLRVARYTLNTWGRVRRAQGLTTEYTDAMRGLRLGLSTADASFPSQFDRRIFGPYYLFQ